MPAFPVHVIFRGMPHSYPLESHIRDYVEWLNQFEPDIVSCRVLVEVPHRHQHEGRTFRVRISLTVPDAPALVVDREQPSREMTKGQDEYQDAYVLVRDAFDVARRRLQDFVREQRGFVKAHSR
jgi:hypothetical protein